MKEYKIRVPDELHDSINMDGRSWNEVVNEALLAVHGRKDDHAIQEAMREGLRHFERAIRLAIAKNSRVIAEENKQRILQIRTGSEVANHEIYLAGMQIYDDFMRESASMTPEEMLRAQTRLAARYDDFITKGHLRVMMDADDRNMARHRGR